MAHFRHLLSPKTKFIWTEHLEREFGLAKASIVRKIHKGVTMFEVDRISALVCDWSKEGQSLGLWQKHCSCKGDITILCCKGGWKIVFMSSRFNNDAQSRYSPIEGECLTLFWAINKADFFIYGCDKLYIGTDHRPLLAFFRKEDPKPLDHISNKRLRKYVSEIGELRLTMFHIEGAKNYLADQGSRLPTGSAGNDKGDGGAGELDSAKVIGAAGAEIRANTVCSWPPNVLPTDDILSYPKVAQIFAYGADSPSEDAEVLGEEKLDSDDYVGQCMLEVAAYLSISAGRRVSLAMTIDKLREEIQSDESYKYIRQVVDGTVQIAKFEGKLAVYNYHRDRLTVSPEGLVMFKGSRFLVPEALRPGLLKALHTGHAGVVSMITRAKEVFWWPCITPAIELVRANCRV